ncbi:MAG: NADH-quinone oxidoreductase subunit L [Myxococcota bacterium]
MNVPELPSWTVGLCAIAIPSVLALTALIPGRSPMRRGKFATSVTLGLTLVTVMSASLNSSPLTWLRMDGVTLAMMGLLSTLSCVLMRFSERYLDGELHLRHYVRWLIATLASVWLLVLAEHLLVFFAAWVSTSMSLHQLLTFYRDRPKAMVAAHKKFLVSRFADVCLFSGIVLLVFAVQGFTFAEVQHWARGQAELPLLAEGAALFFVVGASLKCAQLPFHGWLIQVMEAPTPVSALLHAGVVNIGGFLMIRLAPLMSRAEIAQSVLLAIGATTTLLAALSMKAQPSIKARLAWSTSAQMGFMLVQCSLGAYPLALLHLLAHSFYKAYAFLSSGGVVEDFRVRSLNHASRTSHLGRQTSEVGERIDPNHAVKGDQRVPRRASVTVWLIAALGSLLVTFSVAALLRLNPADESALFAFLPMLGLATTPLLVRAWERGVLAAATVASVGIIAMYMLLHAMFSAVVPSEAVPVPRVLAAALAFLVLFALHMLLETRSNSRLARSLMPQLQAGLYLDELFTRATFRLWPVRLPEAASFGVKKASS